MPLVGKAKGGQKTVANVEVELIDRLVVSSA